MACDFSSFLAKVSAHPRLDYEAVLFALNFAEKSHEGQFRKSGEPYVTHPVEVAELLLPYGADQDSVIAALLHDVVEDTDVEIEEIEALFGESVKLLLDGLTKIEKNKFRKQEGLERKVESLRHWVDVMSKDIRVGVIKLFDRLHNLQTLEGHPSFEKRKAIAYESLDVYAKFAWKFGMWDLANRIGELALKYVEPELSSSVFSVYEEVKKRHEVDFVEVKSSLNQVDLKSYILDVYRLDFSPCRIYRKKYHEKNNLEGIVPMQIHIVVESETHCYQLLQFLHSHWRVRPDGFGDRISSPKPNGWKYLKTTLLDRDGQSLVCRIMTQEMSENLKRGVTDFCFSEDFNSQNIAWLRHLHFVASMDDKNSASFYEKMQHDILEESITVYSKDDVSFFVPATSSILDALFYIYHDKAHYVSSVYLDGVEVELGHPLTNAVFVSAKFDFDKKSDASWKYFCNTAYSNSFF